MTPLRIPTRRLRVVARDPAMLVGGRILTDIVEIDNEWLGAGPRGHRVYIVDYDATTETYYKPMAARAYGTRALPLDPFARASDDELLGNPGFHAQNVYAIVSRTLTRFERALGRRVSWSFGGHQIAAVPHAFADANAFYSDRDRSLLFGYFPSVTGKRMVFSCLSHDVIVHETAHALLDSIRPAYSQPGPEDNLAFHEGFADLIALLSVFSFPSVVTSGLATGFRRSQLGLLSMRDLTVEALRRSVLFHLADEMGAELTGVLGDALRKSLLLTPSRQMLMQPDFREPHRRGEVLVAATLNAFLNVWVERLSLLPRMQWSRVYAGHVVQEGVSAAERLLGAAARALDYAPPLELEFSDFLSALLTADAEASPDDGRDNYRRQLIDSFAAYGIRPASGLDGGLWEPAGSNLQIAVLSPEREDVFRFLYDNWQALGLTDNAFTEVGYVRRNQVPAGRDRLDVLHEFVAGYTQVLRVQARHLHKYGIRRPPAMPQDALISLVGGGTLIFAQNGTLKYHIVNRLLDAERQTRALQHAKGNLQGSRARPQPYAALHRLRQLDLPYSLIDEF